MENNRKDNRLKNYNNEKNQISYQTNITDVYNY
jgi:hypothetical protein